MGPILGPKNIQLPLGLLENLIMQPRLTVGTEVGFAKGGFQEQEGKKPKQWEEEVRLLALYILGLILDTFPKTWLLAQPSSVVQMSQNMSLWYQGPVDRVGFTFYKKGKDKPLQLLDATNINDNKSFFLNNVTNSDAGIYSYHCLLSWKTSIRMTSHNTMELMVVGKC